ncbi:uncharacterized protein F5147DRAFT_655764 [Suillus discolor]|uniref:Uncharacterized protein n=1 Tax=Suillus discolor TaxID=1912936 RepID=A0A9P7F0L0_9AGAM|nr:uncharacterized protein F5147DRAFT_655764 [Suillus discolor]KAG2099568.1 hypothetical protein F5147DRAFT_655764 [Suillus discolor]
MNDTVQIGHIYSPLTDGNDAVIFDWFGRLQHAVETLEGIFFKVAHVLLPQEGCAHATESSSTHKGFIEGLESFTVPKGWKQLWVYTDDDRITRPVIQKIVEPERNIVISDPCASLTGTQFTDSGCGDTGFDDGFNDIGFNDTFFDDDFMSAMISFNGDWVGMDTTAFRVGFPMPAVDMLPSPPAPAITELHFPVPAAAGIGSEYDPVSRGFPTFLLTPITDIALANTALVTPHYVLCDPDVFTDGIKYDEKSLQKNFPVATICIYDAKILARQHLNTHGIKRTLFNSFCKDGIMEMVTVAKHAGRPVERGIKCWETDEVKPLDMECKQIIDIIYKEWDRLVRSRKIHLDGFRLNNYDAKTVIPYIAQLTGLMTWNEILSLIADPNNSGTSYRYHSLFHMFPTQYQKLPEHLIATACGMYVIYFRRRLPGHPSVNISSTALEKESASQLQILRTVGQNASVDLQAQELNSWINTWDGPNGWLEDL